jgi:hypothetical protein
MVFSLFLAMVTSSGAITAQAGSTSRVAPQDAYALMPMKMIPNSRPLSWNRASQSLALAGITGFPNRRSARQTLQSGGRLPAATDRRLLRYHLDTDTTDEVFIANVGFNLMQVKWLGKTADLVFGLENVASKQTGVVVSRRGLEPRVLSVAERFSLITLATSAELPVLIVCLSGSETSEVTAYNLDQTTAVKTLPEGLIAATLRDSQNPGYAVTVGNTKASIRGADTFGIDLRTATIVPESSIPAVTPANVEPVFDFVLNLAPVPGVPGERNDVFAVREGVTSVFLCRNARTVVTSPDGLKAAVWDGSSTLVFEMVKVRK